MKNHFFLLLILSFFSTNLLFAQPLLNEAEFKMPPKNYGVHTWWHWVDKIITREGITKDLESIKKQGIVQATILNVGGGQSANLPVTPVIFNSAEWHTMFRWALQEAGRLGIKIGVHNCDGWSTSGGPWITPEMSMKQYVWSNSFVDGGQEINVKLPEPPVVENYYRDVAVLAIPYDKGPNSFVEAQPGISVNQVSAGNIFYDGNPKSLINLEKGSIIDITFKKDFTASELVLYPSMTFSWDDMAKISNQFTLSSSNDGISFTKIADFEFVGVNKTFTAQFRETNARYFRIKFVQGSGVYTVNCPVAELEILKSGEDPSYFPAISSLPEKTAIINDVSQNVFSREKINGKKAIPENAIIDITDKLADDGFLKWTAPKGKWRIIRFGYTSTGVRNGPATPEGTGLEVDKMDTTALNLHYAGFAEKCVKTAGEFTGNTFKFLLIDSWECQFQNWTKRFPEEFESRRGYKIKNWIPVLCGEIVENETLSEAFLHDFRKTISDLIDEKYYKHFSQLCHRSNLEMHAEIIYANSGMYPPIDALRSNKYADHVMTEFWATPNASQIPEYEPVNIPTPGFPAYSALASNKQIIGSEAYTGYAHYSESPADLKPFGDLAFCSGVNQMILHSYVHQPTDNKPGITLFKFAAHFNRNNPWWEYSQEWMNYQSRIQYVLQKGEPVADVIFYTGDRLPQYLPVNLIHDLPPGNRAGFCNSEMLLNQAKAINGKLSFGGKQVFSLLILPDSEEMNFETLKKIAELVNEGLVVAGKKPVSMLSVTDLKNNYSDFKQLVSELWGNTGENAYGKGRVISGKPIRQVLDEIKVTPDFEYNSSDSEELMFIHKKLIDCDVFFVFNQQKKPLFRELLFRVEEKQPEIWYPENGTILKPSIFSFEDKQVRIPVAFKPNEALIFVFRKAITEDHIKKAYFAGKQIFPKMQDSHENLDTLPTIINGLNDIIVSESGEYTFKTNSGKTFRKIREKPEIIEIKNYYAHLEFFPLSSEDLSPIEVKELKSLTDFENPAIKYFAGKVKYTLQFEVDESLVTTNNIVKLNPGYFDAIAEVQLNGRHLNNLWMPDSEINVTGLLKKVNTLEITVSVVCRNRIIGDLIQFGEIKSIFTTAPVAEILNKNMPLKPSGLTGPIKLTRYDN